MHACTLPAEVLTPNHSSKIIGSQSQSNPFSQHINQSVDIRFAEVTVKMMNKGPDAWRPDQYGDTIIIYRKIREDGGSSWQMRDHQGKCVTTRKVDLQEMSEHMNLNVSTLFTTFAHLNHSVRSTHHSLS